MFPVQAITDAWHWFFFVPVSPISLCVFRILFGFLLLCNGVTLMFAMKAWFGTNGMYPLEDSIKQTRGRHFTLFHILPHSDTSVYIIFALYFAASLGIMVGLCTQTSCILAFILMVSIQTRNPNIVYGADVVMKLMCFLLIFSHAGDMLSFDHCLKMMYKPEVPASQYIASPWCLRLMQIQLAIVYFRAAWWKATCKDWWNGTATYYVMRLQEFKRFSLPKALDKMVVYRLGTWSTLVIEFAMGTLIWIKELQMPVVVCGIMMHLGFELFLNVELFSYVMIACLVLFVPPDTMLSVLHQLRAV